MLSSTRSIYNQTFAGPGIILLKKNLELKSDCTEEEFTEGNKMLLIQPRKRSRATFDNDHATSHPASWQSSTQDTAPCAQAASRFAEFSDVSTTRADSISKTEIAALSLDQLQELSTLVSKRIQIKKRYNNTPLRRIITRQASSSGFQAASRPDSDTASQTDTLVNNELPETAREPLEARRARYNSTPLRRILSRQASTEHGDEETPSAPALARYEPESPAVRKARYNNTPLRRIVSRQTSSEAANTPQAISDSPAPSSPIPVPRSNTPLRRILSRQASAQPVSKKEDDELSERADSVIDPDSPIRSRTAAPAVIVSSNDEDRIRGYETALWNLTSTSTSRLTSASASAAKLVLNNESKIRAYEEILWAKFTPASPPTAVEKRTTITVAELVDARKPQRIVVDLKGSPLRRILQRQSSRDWKATARVDVV